MLLFSQFWSDVAAQQTCPCFLGSDKVCQSSIQCGNSIKSHRFVRRGTDDRQTDRQTDKFVKTVFSDTEDLKT